MHCEAEMATQTTTLTFCMEPSLKEAWPSFEGIDLFDMNVKACILRVPGYWGAAALFEQLQP